MKNFRFVITAAFAAYCKATGVKGISVDYALQKGDDTIPELPEGTEPALRLRFFFFDVIDVFDVFLLFQFFFTYLPQKINK